MRIKVLFFAELKEIFGPSRAVDLREDSTIEDLVNFLAGESEEIALKKASLVYAVNETFEPLEKKLRDRDELALLTPLSGG